MIFLTISIIFIFGYCLIALENVLHVNKAATAILTGVVCWTLCMLDPSDKSMVSTLLMENVADIAGILFFLMGAMTIVEIIDAHDGFDCVAAFLRGNRKRTLLWIVGFVSFFLSAILDNLTTTIVMISLLSKILPKREDLLVFAGLVIIAVNAGGAWSPIGDVTTTMLWIGSQITSLSIIKSSFLPSFFCLLVPLVFLTFTIRNSVPEASQPGKSGKSTRTSMVVFFLGTGLLLCVPLFKTITHLPPFIGMLFGLGILWIVTGLLHKKSDPEENKKRSVERALQRIDMQSILFFLGILLSVAALQTAGVLPALALWLNNALPNVNMLVFITGLFSAIVDNVPLVAAAIKMYPLSQFPTDHHFWSFLSYCVGTGGSVLVIGSAAGIAAMGMTKMDFFWYLKKISLPAFLGYAAGAGVYLLLIH